MFAELKNEIDKGVKGFNIGFPTGHVRAAENISVRPNQYVVIGGSTGSGKSSYTDDAFVLNPVEYYLANKDKSPKKLKVYYRSMERSAKYKLGRWLCRRIFLDHGITLSVTKLFGWFGSKLTPNEYELVMSYEDYIQSLLEVITIIPGAENPVGIAKHFEEVALEHGKILHPDEYRKVYVPDDPNLVVQFVIDHVGLIKTTKDKPTKKQAIDAVSESCVKARDLYGHSFVIVQQYNRNLGDGSKGKDITPQLSDFAETSQTTHDADLVLALFDPLRFKMDESDGYKPPHFRDKKGGKRYRSLRILKATMGPDDIAIGLGFQPVLGIFKELPKAHQVTKEVVDSVLSDKYFRYGI